MNLLTAPVFPNDEQKTRIARALHSLLIGVSVAQVLLLVANLILAERKFAGSALILSGMAVNLLAWWITRRGRVQLACVLFLSIQWLIIAIFVLLSNGPVTIAACLFIAIIVMAMQFLGRRASVLFAVMSLTFTFALISAPNLGITLTQYFPLPPLMSWFLLVYGVVVTLIPVISINNSLNEALNAARSELNRREQAEQAKQASEDRYRIISEMLFGYTFASVARQDGSFEQDWITEEAYTRLTGYKWTEIGNSFNLYHPEDAQRAIDDVQKTLQGHETSGEYRVITKDGRPLWLSIRRKPIWSEEEGRVVRYFGAAEDITDRKNAEMALQRNEALLRALLDATTDVAFLTTADGTVLTTNKAMSDSMRLPIDAIVGRVIFNLIAPEISAVRRPYFDTAIQSREPVRWEDLATSGWWDNSIYPVVSATGTVEAFAVFSRNITDRKRLEAEIRRYTEHLEQMVEERSGELRRAKEQIEIILNNTSDALALSQPNGDIQTLNPAFIAMFDEQTTTAIEHILRVIASDEQIAAVGNALIHVIYDSETRRTEAQIISKDGKDRDIDLALIPVYMSAEQKNAGVLLSARDITHLKEIERFKARFVADAVHDLATPISALSTRLYTLKRTPERLEEHVRALENQVRHLRDLLGDLRTLSQLDRGHISLSLESCDLNELLLLVFDTYEPIAMQKQQSLTLDSETTLPLMRLDRRQFERVVINLVSNAINYTPDGKAIDVKACLDGDAVVLTIADQGIGIGADDLPHVFERFYRTEKARSTVTGGTGLGLAIVKEIVELHGGRITVSSELDKGTTFTLRLPVH